QRRQSGRGHRGGVDAAEVELHRSTDLDEELLDQPGRQGLPHRLRTFGQEPAEGVAVAPAQQLASSDDPGRPLRGRAVPGSGIAEESAGQAAASGAGSAARAAATRPAKVVASFTASSARILRSTSTPARRRPWMSRLYVMPFARAAALMRVIHSWRKSPLRSRRSRYAYCMEWSICSLALLYRRGRWPRYP